MASEVTLTLFTKSYLLPFCPHTPTTLVRQQVITVPVMSKGTFPVEILEMIADGVINPAVLERPNDLSSGEIRSLHDSREADRLNWYLASDITYEAAKRVRKRALVVRDAAEYDWSLDRLTGFRAIYIQDPLPCSVAKKKKEATRYQLKAWGEKLDSQIRPWCRRINEKDNPTRPTLPNLQYVRVLKPEASDALAHLLAWEGAPEEFTAASLYTHPHSVVSTALKRLTVHYLMKRAENTVYTAGLLTRTERSAFESLGGLPQHEGVFSQIWPGIASTVRTFDPALTFVPEVSSAHQLQIISFKHQGILEGMTNIVPVV